MRMMSNSEWLVKKYAINKIMREKRNTSLLAEKVKMFTDGDLIEIDTNLGTRSGYYDKENSEDYSNGIVVAKYKNPYRKREKIPYSKIRHLMNMKNFENYKKGELSR